MRFIFTTLFFVSSLASTLVLAQTPDKDISHTTTSDEKNQDIIGTIAVPTKEQKKYIKKAAKNAAKKAKKKSTKKVTQ